MTYLAIERFDRHVDSNVFLHHQEDLAQALSLDWRDTNVKFQEPEWPSDPKRASVRRIAEALGSIPGGDSAVEQWLRQLTFHVAIGNNDTRTQRTSPSCTFRLAPKSRRCMTSYRICSRRSRKWDLALAINGVFDHRRISAETILAEVHTWGVIAQTRASALVSETLDILDDAITEVAPPKGVSDGMIEHLQWNVRRLLAGQEISEPRA